MSSINYDASAPVGQIEQESEAAFVERMDKDGITIDLYDEGRECSASRDFARLIALARIGARVTDPSGDDGWQTIASGPVTPHAGKPQYVLVTNGKHVGVGFRMEADYPGEPEWFDEHTEFLPDVTHWRPLPSAPSKQEAV